MFARLAVAAACSVAALKYAQLKAHNDNINASVNVDADTNANANANSNCNHEEQNPKCREDAKEGCQESNREIHTYPATETTQNEAEEEVKRVSSCSPVLPSNGFQEGEEQLLLPEFDDLFSGRVEFHSDSSSDESRARRRRKSDGGDSSSFKEGRSKVGGGDIETRLRKYDSSSSDDEALEIFVALASRASSPVRHENEANEVELMQLRAIVSELQEKEMRLEAELLEYYGLKEQEQSYGELERQLREKDAEIEALNSRINALEEEKRELLQEVSREDSLKQELDLARAKLKELQRQLQRDAGDTKANLLLLKQQVAALREKEKEREQEEERPKLDLELERKLQALKELEVEVVELRRLNKELQHEKRELTVKLALADARIAELSSISESELVSRSQADAASLRHANQDLSKQVEGLQMNRFCEVEELVYLRWVNACLRYELRNFKAPPGKFTALDLGKSMSPRSQERAKELMLEYAGPDLLEMKWGGKDRDDGFSVPSTPSSDYGDDLLFDVGGNGKASSGSKKSNLIRMLKKWGNKGKDDTHMSHNLSADSSRSNPSRASGGHRRSSSSSGSKGPLEALLSRNTSDAVAITTYGANDWLVDDQHGSVSPSGDLRPLPGSLPRVRTRSEDNSAIASDVAASFHLMSRSSSDIPDEKYPAFKDRHKLASAREAAIKERAEHARAEKLRVSKSTMLKMPEKVALRTTSIEQEATERETLSARSDLREVNKLSLSITKVEKREPRVSKPPPKPLVGIAPPTNKNLPLIGGGSIPIPPPPPPSLPGGPPPPPPPPPPGGLQKVKDIGGQKVRRAPEVVEFYHSLMRRESRRDSTATLGFADADVADARSNIVGEIENRSTFLLAVKADVETQGDFVMSLATEVRAAIYASMDDVVAFVGWLDEELSFLVDERAVLKHFDWPETKADGLREAAFEYLDLKKVESEISSFEDDLGLPCDVALKKMLSLLEKVEQSVYALLRTRDIAIARYKEFNIPVYWMLDSGLIGKIKFSAIQLARKYMKRVASELDLLGDSSENEPYREYVLLQAVRFAFRVHQFSGGFDAESMRVFEGLRNRVQARTGD